MHCDYFYKTSTNITIQRPVHCITSCVRTSDEKSSDGYSAPPRAIVETLTCALLVIVYRISSLESSMNRIKSPEDRPIGFDSPQ